MLLKMLLKTTSVYCVVAPLILSTHIRAQQTVSDELIKLRTDLVVLDIQVLNRQTGHPISNLQKEDFSLYEDGVKQEILHFSQDGIPLSIILLLDVSSSIQPVINQVRDNALDALQQLKPEDEVAIIIFASKAKLVQDFTKNRELIKEQIIRIKDESGVGRGTLLDAGIHKALDHLPKASNSDSRRVIIAITDNVSARSREYSEKDLLNSLIESGTVVCGLVVKSWFSHTQNTVLFLRRFLASSNLKKYASETGGEVLNASQEVIEVNLLKLIQHLRARYTLAYVSSNQASDGRFRKVKVTLSTAMQKREGKLSVFTRKGYYSRKR